MPRRVRRGTLANCTAQDEDFVFAEASDEKASLLLWERCEMQKCHHRRRPAANTRSRRRLHNQASTLGAVDEGDLLDGTAYCVCTYVLYVPYFWPAGRPLIWARD